MVYNIILEKTNNWVSQMDGSIYSFPGNFILNLIISLYVPWLWGLTCSYLVLKLFSPKNPPQLFVQCSKPFCLPYLYYNVSELSHQSGYWLCWDRHLLSWSWLYDRARVCLNPFYALKPLLHMGCKILQPSSTWNAEFMEKTESAFPQSSSFSWSLSQAMAFH